MSRRHNRKRKKLRQTRNQRADAALCTPTVLGPDDDAPVVRRSFTLGVRGGWNMEFTTSGVAVPFDPEATEAPPLAELTLGEVLRKESPEGDA